MEKVQSSEHDLKYLLEEISPYDPVDMLASIAGLQLLPENADKSIRFEAFAYAATSLLEEEGKKCISINKINFLLNRSSFSEGSIKLMEDPMANPFTESITFLNGSYIVFPWNLEESTFVFRQLIKALFNFTDPFPNSEFIKQATMLISACLLLSNEIALRAGLKRDMDPISKNGKIYIPDRKIISKLKTAVSFSLSELEIILTKHGIERSILDRLTIVPGSFSASKYQIDENNLLAKPIVRFKNKIVISIPGMLLPATRNETILLAKEYGLDEKLAKRYNLAVWGNVIDSLRYLDNKTINMPKCNPLDISCARDAFFILDTDKLVYAIMVTDQLINYESIFSDWPFDDLSREIEARLEYIKGYIASFEQPPNDILFLVLVQGIGRRYVVGFGDRAVSVQFPLLGFSAADLETIAILEAGEKLALWKYACSKEIIRKNTFVHRGFLLTNKFSSNG